MARQVAWVIGNFAIAALAAAAAVSFLVPALAALRLLRSARPVPRHS